MTEDIVEFGAPTAPKPKRAPRGDRPEWLNNRMLPVAAVGALCGLGSLMLPWQKLTVRPQQNTSAIIQQADQEIVEATLISLGAFGTAYLLTLIATVTAVAMMLFGHHLVPVATRVLGMALSGANLFVLVATGIAFNRGTIILNVGFVTFGPEEWERTSISLEWGYLAALAAVALLGFAALRAQPLRWESSGGEAGSAHEGGAPGDEDSEPDDGVIDLSVNVHPVGKQVAAG
jgi:hypothetical protein